MQVALDLSQFPADGGTACDLKVEANAAADGEPGGALQLQVNLLTEPNPPLSATEYTDTDDFYSASSPPNSQTALTRIYVGEDAPAQSSGTAYFSVSCGSLDDPYGFNEAGEANPIWNLSLTVDGETARYPDITE